LSRIAVRAYRPGIDSTGGRCPAHLRCDRNENLLDRGLGDMIARTLTSTLLAATAVIALTRAAGATDPNSIGIDVSGTGSTNTLAITQDDANLANYVGNAAGNGSLPVRGPWNTVVIDQQGGANALMGSLTSNTGSPSSSRRAECSSSHMTWVAESSGWRARSTAAAALTCGAANIVVRYRR